MREYRANSEGGMLVARGRRPDLGASTAFAQHQTKPGRTFFLLFSHTLPPPEPMRLVGYESGEVGKDVRRDLLMCTPAS